MSLFILFARELTELRKTNALTQTVAEEAALSAKQNVREEFKRELEEQRLKAEREKDSLLIQVSYAISYK